jgi:catechol 2,3-dioxygenase-like lactoylglutathione lyase family enzyme
MTSAPSSPVPLSFSHIGLFVRDLERMVRFYRDFLGFIVTDRGHLPNGELCFLSRDPREHHQIVLVTGRPEGLPDRIVNQVSFRAATLVDLKAFYETLPRSEVSEIAAVTHGIAWSVYFRDPEGNRIEVFVDTEWYIPQPCREPIDLTQPVERIYAQTRTYCEGQSGFRPFRAWQEDLESRLTSPPGSSPVSS